MLDLDGMGRAYPEVDLCTFTLYGHSAAPLAVADEHGNVAVIDSISNRWAERIARPVAVEMGAIAGGVGFPITVGDLKESAVLGSVTYAESIGRAIRHAREAHENPVQAALESTGGFPLFTGRIVDVLRRIENGWALGEVVIAGMDDDENSQLVVQFQNEHLIAIRDGEVQATVPDLIAILDTERGTPITTEELRYGFRVTVIAIPSDKKWRTPSRNRAWWSQALSIRSRFRADRGEIRGHSRTRLKSKPGDWNPSPTMSNTQLPGKRG